jgi:hypothetical protein
LREKCTYFIIKKIEKNAHTTCCLYYAIKLLVVVVERGNGSIKLSYHKVKNSKLINDLKTLDKESTNTSLKWSKTPLKKINIKVMRLRSLFSYKSVSALNLKAIAPYLAQ